MARWREIVALYALEMRSALRERTIVINSIIIPLVLYPMMLWMTSMGFVFVRGQTAEQRSRVTIGGVTERYRELDRALRQTPRLDVVPAPGDVAAAERSITAGDRDALLQIEPAPLETLPDNVRARITFDGTRERSDTARERLQEALHAFRERRLREETSKRGVDEAAWAGFALDDRNIASSEQMGRFILGLMLPMFFIVMVAVGCFYPAVDTTAGERERGTWETLMATSAARTSIVTAKYLSVTTLGAVAGLLNVAAMALTLGGTLAPMMGRASGAIAITFSVPLAALPVLAAGAVLLAAFIAAGMMVFAAFARTFREGQAMIQPFYLAVLIPTMFLASPGIDLTFALAAVPVVNIALVTREALRDVYHLPQIAMALMVSLAAIVALVRVATSIVEAEDVMVGSYRGSFATFVRERLARGWRPGTRQRLR